MTFIATIAEERAEGPVAEMYAAERAALGYVPGYTRAFSLRPTVYEAWRGLNRAIRAQMDPRRYELVTLAAARRLRSSYCSLAHGKVLLDKFLALETLRGIAADPRAAGLDPVDVAVMELAEKVVEDASSVAQADVDSLRDLGLSDGEVFDVVAAATARCFFAKTVDGLGTLPDAAYMTMEPELRDALTVGRPIAASS